MSIRTYILIDRRFFEVTITPEVKASLRPISREERMTGRWVARLHSEQPNPWSGYATDISESCDGPAQCRQWIGEQVSRIMSEYLTTPEESESLTEMSPLG